MQRYHYDGKDSDDSAIDGDDTDGSASGDSILTDDSVLADESSIPDEDLFSTLCTEFGGIPLMDDGTEVDETDLNTIIASSI